MLIGFVCGIPDRFGGVLRFDVLFKRNGHNAVLKCTSDLNFDINFLDQVDLDGNVTSYKRFDKKEYTHFCDVINLKRI